MNIIKLCRDFALGASPSRVLTVVGALVLFGFAARPHAATAVGVTEYVAGIDLLDAGAYGGAVKALDRSIAADEQNSLYFRTRGVAYTLSQNFPKALADYRRALQLNPRDREAQLWMGATHTMNGEPSKGRFIYGGDVDVHYAEIVYNQMANQYWESVTHGTYWDVNTNQRMKANGPVTNLFSRVAKMYAQRHRPAGMASTAVIQPRIQRAIAAGDWKAAARDLTNLRQVAPDDPDLRAQWATVLLRLNNALGAREEFTRVLSQRPRWAEGYAGRAEAAAILGDARRARADLAVAESLNAAGAKGLEAQVQKLLGEPAPADAVDQFVKAIAANAVWPKLVEAAFQTHRYSQARRDRYDEQYQDRIRLLDLAVQREPKAPDAYERHARFLLRHHQVPTLWNGVRGEPAPVRPQSKVDRTRELDTALSLTAKALQLDPRHVNAMATRAWIFNTVGRKQEAEKLVNSGLAFEQRSIPLQRLKATLLREHAAALETRAAALRAGHTTTREERRSDGIYEVRTHYPPTAAELAEARAAEAQAKRLRAMAAAADAVATETEQKVIPDLLQQIDAATGAKALALCQKLLTYQPDLKAGLARMARIYDQMGDKENHLLFATLGQPIRHTSANESLQAAWNACYHTAWRDADSALTKAQAADPIDARILAYRSVVADGRSDPTLAGQCRRGALALEEARARLMGTSFLPPAPAALKPAEIGLFMIVASDQGEALRAAGNHRAAIVAFEQMLAAQPRVAELAIYPPLPEAMLPHPATDTTRIPEAPTLAAMFANAHLGLARSALETGDFDSAQRHFMAIQQLENAWPATMDGRQSLYVPKAWSIIGIADAQFRAGRLDMAQGGLSFEGDRKRLPPELYAYRDDLRQKVAKARRDQQEAELRAPLQGVDLSRMRQGVERDLAQLKAQRQQYLEAANRPGLSAQEREMWKRQVESIERVIAQRERNMRILSGEQPFVPDVPPPSRGNRPP